MKEVETLGKAHFWDSGTQSLRMKLYKKIKNSCFYTQHNLQPNNKQQQLTTEDRDIPHLMA